jgi:maltooligosyltrehalose trehalohydrolase
MGRMLPRLGAHVLPGGGARFLAWAPRRRRVSLPFGELQPVGDGLWQLDWPEAGPGTRYAYRLDDEGPFPDPYARALPDGPHGQAEVVDPSAFAWTDHAWPGLSAEGLVVYELHVGTFTPEGTFDGAIARLPYLRDLGVSAIELMPVSTFPGRRNWGYDGVGHYAPAAVYGGPEGLRRLVDAAHAHGLGVIVDVVYNHLGPSGNYLGAFSPEYFTERVHTPWGAGLDYANPWVRAWAIENAVHFLTEYHADGLRLDAVHEIHDPTLVGELAARCRAAVPRPVVLIAEDERHDLARLPGVDAYWADDFHHALRTLLTPDRRGYYARYAGTAAELARFAGAGGRETVFCTENHDQVGNRALGERLAHLVSPGTYLAASALLLLLPATPMLFMGQEFAASTPFLYFTDHDPDLGKSVTEGRRKEFEAFGWDEVPDPQAEATFRRSKLDWRDAERNGAVLARYRDLLRLRRGVAGPARVAPLGDRAVAATLASGHLVVANFGPAATFALDVPGGCLFSTGGTPTGGVGMPAETTALFGPT